MNKTITQIENLLIIQHLFHSLKNERLHYSYYNEKCDKYLGLIPEYEVLFKTYEIDAVFVYNFKVKSIEQIIDGLWKCGMLSKISNSNNIFEYDDVHGKTTRGNGKYFKIIGLHDLLTKKIMESSLSIPDGIIRKYNLRKLLCENS